MIRIAFTSFILTLLYCTQALAQNGDYFVTKKNDTIQCKTLQESMFSAKKFKYTTSKMTESRAVNLDTVYEYSTDNIIYTRRVLPGDSLLSFVIWIERGKIDLYQLLIPGMKSSVSYFYAAKDNGPLVEVKTDNQLAGAHKKRVKAVDDLLLDVPDIHARFNPEVDFSYKKIHNLIKEYNSFTSPANDHFINNNNKLVKCKIVMLLADSINKNTFSYRLTETGDFTYLNLDSIKEYTYKDSIFTKLTLPGDTVAHFTYMVMQGKINLYEYNSPTQGKNLFAIKNNGAPVAIASKKGTRSNNEAKNKAFCDLIADFPELLNQFNSSADKGLESVELTVKTYNKLKK